MMSLDEAARLLNGVVAGDQVVCPGPGHSRRDRSLAVRFVVGTRDGFVVYSHCGDDPIACKDHVRRCLGMPAFSSSSSTATPRPPIMAKAPPAPPKPDQRVTDLCNSGRAIEETLGEAYLRGRGITGELPVALRFLEASRHPLYGTCHPTMMAALAEPTTPVLAVQCTYLDKAGTKASIAEPRITRGKMYAGAVQLGWPSSVLGLAEGVETGLSAMQLFCIPVWCCLGAPRMPTIKVPSGVKEIHLFADGDEAGVKAANQAIEQFNQQGEMSSSACRQRDAWIGMMCCSPGGEIVSDDKMGNVKFFPAPPRPEQDPPTATDGIAFKVEGQERPRIKLVPFNEIQLKTERRDLVKNLVPRIGVTVIWGPPKSGKSFFTFDMVMHVSLGWEYPWPARSPRTGRVRRLRGAERHQCSRRGVQADFAAEHVCFLGQSGHL